MNFRRQHFFKISLFLLGVTFLWFNLSGCDKSKPPEVEEKGPFLYPSMDIQRVVWDIEKKKAPLPEDAAPWDGGYWEEQKYRDGFLIKAVKHVKSMDDLAYLVRSAYYMKNKALIMEKGSEILGTKTADHFSRTGESEPSKAIQLILKVAGFKGNNTSQYIHWNKDRDQFLLASVVHVKNQADLNTLAEQVYHEESKKLLLQKGNEIIKGTGTGSSSWSSGAIKSCTRQAYEKMVQAREKFEAAVKAREKRKTLQKLGTEMKKATEEYKRHRGQHSH
ncbi:hypothetical protein ACFL35_13960 [Candidatus Riflebacteria bacterium]